MDKIQIAKGNSDLKNLEIGNLTDFQKQVVISNSGQKIETATLKELGDMFKYLFAYTGIRAYPNEYEKKVLIENTKLLLKKYTIQDVKTAFNLATEGIIQYDLKLYDRIFNIVYLSDLMKVYELYRSTAMLKYKNALEEQKLKDKEPSEEEKAKLNLLALKNGCLELFERCKKTDISIEEVDISPEGNRYEFLKSLQLFNYSEEQISVFRSTAIEKIKAQNEAEQDKNKKKGNAFLKALNVNSNEKQRLELYIKNLIVLDYFKTLINLGRELKTEIENKK